MKVLKRITCSVLALAMVIGLTACAPKKFDKQKLINFLDDQDFDDYDEPEDFYDDFSGFMIGVEGSSYVCCDGRDAKNVYKTLINRFGDFKDYDIEETVALAINDGGGYGYGCLFTFEDAKDAGKFFKKYGEMYADDGENGDEKSYSYYIKGDETNTAGRELYCGIYIRENTVFVIRFLGVDSDFVDDLCEVYGVISPTEA